MIMHERELVQTYCRRAFDPIVVPALWRHE